MKSLAVHILYLVVTIGYGQLYSQPLITGTIIDYDTKEPIPGLTVYLESNNSNSPIGRNTNTDREGKFSLFHSSNDTVNLIIEKLNGYSTITTVKNIYSHQNIDLGKIHHLQLSDIICILPDVSDRKTKKALKRKNKTKDSISTIGTDNSILIVNCAPYKNYKIIITNGTAAIEFKDILNCQN